MFPIIYFAFVFCNIFKFQIFLSNLEILGK